MRKLIYLLALWAPITSAQCDVELTSVNWETGDVQMVVHNSDNCGIWFVDDAWYREPFVDKQGNALREKAIVDIDLEREEKKKADPKAYNMMVTQHPHTPKEAFLRSEGAVFPAIELYNVLAKLKADDRYKKLGSPGTLFEEEGVVRFKPDLEKRLFPINKYPHGSNDPQEGCPVVYQHPPEIIPHGLYKIGLDPVAFDKSGGEVC